MKNYKRIMAFGLAATMVMGSSMVVCAEGGSGSTTGDGELEGTVSKDVVSVVLPSIAVDDTTFDFILDPEGLIDATSAARYNSATFGTGTLFFANTNEDGDVTGYSNASDALTVINKSSIPVDVSLSAAVTDATGITLTDDSTFADDTSASVYLAITDGTNTVPITDAGASVSTQIDAAPTGSYKVQWNSTDEKYEFVLADEANTEFAEYSFQLTGASNTAGDWSGLEEVAPSVEVVWNVSAHLTTPGITGATTYTVTSGTTVVVPVSLGEGNTAATGVSSLTYVNASGVTKTVATSDYTYADGTLTLSASAVNVFVESSNATRTYTITFNDDAATTATFTLSK